MSAEAERVLTVAGVCRAAGGLDIGDPIGLGTEHSEKGLRVHRSCAHLEIERLLDHTTFLGPEVLEIQNQGLQVHFPPAPRIRAHTGREGYHVGAILSQMPALPRSDRRR